LLVEKHKNRAHGPNEDSCARQIKESTVYTSRNVVRGLSPKLSARMKKKPERKCSTHARDIMIVHKFKVLVGVAHEIQIL